ncbi:MAG: hypothetical protein RIR97_1606 [Pseudomonadota bacterium]|jgi:endogenous inhibitor of DNA gyrase (YacG/DUF329 family)
MANDEPIRSAKIAPLRKAIPCPECKRPSHREHYPFCSDRCRNADLARWLNGAYAIPVVEDDASRSDDDEY